MPEPIGAWPPAEIGPALISVEQLRARIAELGRQITGDYEGRDPVLVCVLKGAFVFMADIARAIELPVEVDFMALSSYGMGTSSSGVVRIVKDLEIDLTGRDVIVIEDIVDSGLTLAWLLRHLRTLGPASVEVCALLVKVGLQPPSAEPAKYVGFEIPPDFVVGYGLDVSEKFRNLSGIYTYLGE